MSKKVFFILFIVIFDAFIFHKLIVFNFKKDKHIYYYKHEVSVSDNKSKFKKNNYLGSNFNNYFGCCCLCFVIILIVIAIVFISIKEISEYTKEIKSALSAEYRRRKSFFYSRYYYYYYLIFSYFNNFNNLNYNNDYTQLEIKKNGDIDKIQLFSKANIIQRQILRELVYKNNIENYYRYFSLSKRDPIAISDEEKKLIEKDIIETNKNNNSFVFFSKEEEKRINKIYDFLKEDLNVAKDNIDSISEMINFEKKYTPLLQEIRKFKIKLMLAKIYEQKKYAQSCDFRNSAEKKHKECINNYLEYFNLLLELEKKIINNIFHITVIVFRRAYDEEKNFNINKYSNVPDTTLRHDKERNYSYFKFDEDVWQDFVSGVYVTGGEDELIVNKKKTILNRYDYLSFKNICYNFTEFFRFETEEKIDEKMRAKNYDSLIEKMLLIKDMYTTLLYDYKEINTIFKYEKWRNNIDLMIESLSEVFKIENKWYKEFPAKYKEIKKEEIPEMFKEVEEDLTKSKDAIKQSLDKNEFFDAEKNIIRYIIRLKGYKSLLECFIFNSIYNLEKVIDGEKTISEEFSKLYSLLKEKFPEYNYCFNDFVNKKKEYYCKKQMISIHQKIFNDDNEDVIICI